MPPITISPDTKFRLSMGLACAAIIGAVGFGFSLQRTVGGIEQKFDKFTERLDAFEHTMTDRWTKTAAAEWALRLKLANPQLAIPDPRDPSKLLSY